MSKRSPELFDLIEDYLRNELDDVSQKKFKKRLETDTDFRKEFEKHKQLHQTLLDQDSIMFRKKLMRIENENSDSVNSKESRFTFNWKIAAMIFVLLGLGLFFLFQNKSSEKSLFEKYYTVYPVEDTFRGNQEKDLQLSLRAYGRGDYKEAEILLNGLIDKRPEADELKIYLGCTYLELTQPEKALSEFESLIDSVTYSEQANWYKALTYLKMNQSAKVISLLEDIIAFDGIYKNDAMNLYSNLKKEKDPDDL